MSIVHKVKRTLFPVTCGIKVKNIYDYVGKLDNLNLSLADWNKDQRAGNFFDLLTIVSLVKYKSPKNFFEFGTGFGRTALQFAKNTSEDAKIWTLDQTSESQKGSIFLSRPEKSKITMLVGDSKKLDFPNLYNSMDMIFIDGGHDYETVKSDTLLAFKLANKKCLILWDDFSPDWPGVVKAVNEFKKDHSIYRIAGTGLAACELN